jgi:DNA-binding Xre family transcriptional regulator
MIRLKVREVAEQKQVSQARLSRLSDVDIKAIRRMYREPDKANIRLETLNKLAYALKVDARELLEYERDAFLPGVEEDDPPEQSS